MLLHPPRIRDGFEVLARRRLGDVDSARHARVVAVNETQSVDGLFDIADRAADERLLDGAMLAILVDGSEVPRGRDDDLITLDLATGDLLGVVEGAARGLPETSAGTGVGEGLGEVRGVATGNCRDELLRPVLHELGDVKRLDLADSRAAEHGDDSGSRSSSGSKSFSGGSRKKDSEEAESSSVDGIPADGEYEPDSFSFSGGTGKLQITCDKVTIKNGKAYAVLTFSSGKIIYMKVDGEQYDPVSQTEDTSVYEVPVSLNTNYPVIACTTAMSQPHEIEYTVYIGLGQNEKDIEENLIQVDNAPEVAGFSYQGTVENEAAELFRIHYYSGDVKVLEVCLSDAEDFSWDEAEEETDQEKSLYGGEVLRYLIVPEGTELPAGLSETMIVVQAPVDTVYTDLESNEWLPEDLTRIEPETSWMDPAVYRMLLSEGADLAVIDAAEAEAAEAALEFGDGCELLGIPVLLDRSEAEKEAAGSEEWEKVYSLFVNRTGNNTEDSMKNRPENSIENNSEKSTGDRKPEL